MKRLSPLFTKSRLIRHNFPNAFLLAFLLKNQRLKSRKASESKFAGCLKGTKDKFGVLISSVRNRLSLPRS